MAGAVVAVVVASNVPKERLVATRVYPSRMTAKLHQVALVIKRPSLEKTFNKDAPDLKFSKLRLARDPETGGVTFDWEPIERLCEYNNLDIEIFEKGPEDNVAGLIIAWYAAHRAHGG